MNVLLDTHIAIWALAGSPKLPQRAVEIVEDPRNRIFVSDVSLWEVAMKHMAKPKGIALDAERFLKRCQEAGYQIQPLASEAILACERLDLSAADGVHKDPFDRMLLSQAKVEGIGFLTSDRALTTYGEWYVSLA